MIAVEEQLNNFNDHELEHQDSIHANQQHSLSDTVTNNHPISDGGRDARIALRKARIEAVRIGKFRPNSSDDVSTRRAKKVEVENRKVSTSKTHITIGIKRITSVKENGNETVTNIRAGITARESIRRSDESKKMVLWENREIQEQLSSKKAAAKISGEWIKVEKLNGPFELSQLLTQQKQACQDLLDIKTDLIEEYVSKLKLQDDEYVRELKRQTEEIDKLLERMEMQYKNYRVALVEEAEHIEQAFVDERNDLLHSNNSETSKLFDNRKGNEANYMHERANRIEDYIKQLEQLRVSDSEEYNLVKIKLETDVQVLEQQLQQMRVTYLLNQEKLEYNYQVLKKREEENGTILGAQKRKINRLADHLNVLKIKSVKQEKSFQQENTSLTDDYKHLTEQYKELQKKFRHFQARNLADSKRFKDIWKMNEEEAKEIMRKVLQADRIILEQQLGMKWEPPTEDLFRNVDPLSFHHAFFNSNSVLQGASKNIKEVEADFENVMNSRAVNGTQAADTKESLSAKFQDLKTTSKTMKKTLELLCNEAGFLVEDKLQKLLAPLHTDEQSLMRLDSIFKALGVVTVEDIERLSSFFIDSSTEKQKLIYSDEAVLIHPNQVISAIRKFVDGSKGEMISAQPLSEGSIRSTIKEEVSDSPPGSESAVNTNKMQDDYWNRMANVIDEKNYRTWSAVYVAMEKYYTLLTERSQTLQKISAIGQQNTELKALLRQYMNSRVNDELEIPPTQIMIAQAGILSSD